MALYDPNASYVGLAPGFTFQNGNLIAPNTGAPGNMGVSNMIANPVPPGKEVGKVGGTGSLATPNTTGPGGSPQTGTPYVPPTSMPGSQNYATGSNYITGSYNGMTPTQSPDLDSYIRSQLNNYFSPSRVEQGTAQPDITEILRSSAMQYLAANPSAGDPASVNQLVGQYGSQYSQWLQQYKDYLSTNNVSLPQGNSFVPHTPAAPVTQSGAVGGTGTGGIPPQSSYQSGHDTLAAQIAGVAGSPQQTQNPHVLDPANYGGTPGVGTGLGPGDPWPTPGSGASLKPVSNFSQLIYSPGAAPGSPASTPGVGVTPGPGGSWPNGAPAYNDGGVGSMLTGQMQPPYTAPPAPGLTADQQLAYNSGDTNYLRSIVESGGAPINATPAWQAAVDAMKHQNDVGLANLKEQFGASGNRFSTAFGGAAADYMNQATLNNNALLGQMMMSSQENAANRMTTGAGQLSSQAHSGLSQLSSQDFQAAMQATGNNLQAALAMLNAGYGAASQLNQGAIQGATALHNTENNAVSLGASMSNQAFQSYLQNLGLGSQLGGQQSTLDQNTLSALYQEFLRTQPQYNPMMSYFANGANTYPNLFTPQFQASQLGQILAGLGGLAGASPEILSMINTLYNNTKKNSGNNGSGGLPSIGTFGSDIGGYTGSGPIYY